MSSHVRKVSTSRIASSLIRTAPKPRRSKPYRAVRRGGLTPSSIVAKGGLRPLPLYRLKAQIREHESRWYKYLNDWLLGQHPDPTDMLTINLPQAELNAYMMSGKSASSLRGRIMDEIRRKFRFYGYPWLAMWAMETHRWTHVHILLWLPNDEKLKRSLARWLVKRFSVLKPPNRSNLQFLIKPPSGSPVQLEPISDSKSFKRTGKFGVRGLADYLMKDLDKVLKEKHRLKMGKVIGRTRDLG